MELGSAVLGWPVAARPHQILIVHLADSYRVRIDGGQASPTPDMSIIGPQTYRRAHVCLSGSVPVFSILFQPTGLNRLVGIDMTSLVNHDPAASDVLGKSATTVGDTVRLAPDFERRVAAVERWVEAMLRAVGVPRTRIERLANEQTPVTADTALRLGRFFGTSAAFWMGI